MFQLKRSLWMCWRSETLCKAAKKKIKKIRTWSEQQLKHVSFAKTLESNDANALNNKKNGKRNKRIKGAKEKIKSTAKQMLNRLSATGASCTGALTFLTTSKGVQNWSVDIFLPFLLSFCVFSSSPFYTSEYKERLMIFHTHILRKILCSYLGIKDADRTEMIWLCVSSNNYVPASLCVCVCVCIWAQHRHGNPVPTATHFCKNGKITSPTGRCFL